MFHVTDGIFPAHEHGFGHQRMTIGIPMDVAGNVMGLQIVFRPVPDQIGIEVNKTGTARLRPA